MTAAPGFAGYITGAALLGESGRRNSQTDTTRIHSKNRNCGKNAIEARARTPTRTPSHPAHFGQTAPDLNANEAAMIMAPSPAAPLACKIGRASCRERVCVEGGG